MSERAMRLALMVFGVLNLVTGALMFLAPDFFFDHIGPYGTENSHYLGDLGAAYLAGGLGLLIAVRRPTWRVPMLAVWALWYGLHALNHLFDIGQNNHGDSRGISDTVLIALGALALGYLARVASRQVGAGPVRPAPTQRRRDYPPGD